MKSGQSNRGLSSPSPLGREIEGVRLVYFLGIGGIGMSALARFFMAQNCKVYGYDKTATPLTQQLEEEGAIIHYQEDVDLVAGLFSSFQEETGSLVIYTPAIPNNHKELVYFREQGIKLFKRSEILGLITQKYFTIAVAGTHGKTTTSSMVAHVLTECGVDCIAFLGGISLNFNSNIVLKDNAKMVVVEADEFDRSFLTLVPNIALITSIDADHLDIYGDHHEMHKSYQDFVNKINKEGILITKPSIKEQLSFVNTKTYSIQQRADYHAHQIKVENGKYLVNINQGETIAVGLPGKHNVENALGAYAIAKQLNIEDAQILKAISTYKGVKRRFEYHVNRNDRVYIDDYAHHPEELKICIESIKELYPDKKITGIFQPHLYTRTRDFMDEFAASLSLLDELILLDIYPARELPLPGITSTLLLEKTTCAKKTLTTKNELVELVVSKSPEVLLTLGAGDIDALVEPLTKALTPLKNNQIE